MWFSMEDKIKEQKWKLKTWKNIDCDNMYHNLTAVINNIADDLGSAHLWNVMAKCLIDLTELFTLYFHQKKIYAWEI